MLRIIDLGIKIGVSTTYSPVGDRVFGCYPVLTRNTKPMRFIVLKVVRLPGLVGGFAYPIDKISDMPVEIDGLEITLFMIVLDPPFRIPGDFTQKICVSDIGGELIEVQVGKRRYALSHTSVRYNAPAFA